MRALGFCCLFLWLYSSTLLLGQHKPSIKPFPKKTRILLVLDGSGSMLARWEGNTRINIAKKIIGKLADSLSQLPDVEVGLRVYGHRFDRKYQNCEDTQLEVNFGASNSQAIRTRLESIVPKGLSPIATTLIKAGDDFPVDEDHRNIVILITDGIESCGKDPCAVSKALQKRHIFLQPFIIGLGMEAPEIAQFGCIGSVYNAKTIQAFDNKLRQIIQHSLHPAKTQIYLLDTNREATVSDVNISFVNTITGHTAYNFVHYLAPDGTVAPVSIDPVTSYHVVVNTIPPVTRRDVHFAGNQNNVLRIPCPQGQLQITQTNQSTYPHLQGIIREEGKAKIIHHFEVGKTVQLLVGRYEVELLTTPRTLQTIDIRQDETTTLQLATPGILNIKDHFAGYGSLYQIDEEGRSQWVLNLGQPTIAGSMALQPGRYTLVIRSVLAHGMEYTIEKTFDIQPGLSTNVALLKGG